ncbi:hypothetical protein AGDE_16339 [Angomonas deanei]|nr:hypothetical protein AGDE_16339 [Angomonas deanei]|eukprot:EPY17284.1 hypothetical protein AGDE_16339 [Angomonas deanei]
MQIHDGEKEKKTEKILFFGYSSTASSAAEATAKTDSGEEDKSATPRLPLAPHHSAVLSHAPDPVPASLPSLQTTQSPS